MLAYALRGIRLVEACAKDALDALFFGLISRSIRAIGLGAIGSRGFGFLPLSFAVLTFPRALVGFRVGLIFAFTFAFASTLFLKRSSGLFLLGLAALDVRIDIVMHTSMSLSVMKESHL